MYLISLSVLYINSAPLQTVENHSEPQFFLSQLFCCLVIDFAYVPSTGYVYVPLKAAELV